MGLRDAYMSSLGAFIDAFVLIRYQVGVLFHSREAVEMQTEVHLLTPDGGPVRMAGGRKLLADAGLESNTTAYNLIHIPGFVVGDEQALVARLAASSSLCRWLRQQYQAGALVSASGSGVFLLAEAGLVDDGWVAIARPLIPMFRRRFPNVRVDHSKAVVTQQRVITGSGLAADPQLLVRLVESVTTPELARWLGDVTGLRHTAEEQIADDPLIANAQVWLEERFAQKVRIADLAAAMSVTQQTLLRHFRRCLHTTPQAYLCKVRVEAAQRLLLRTNRPIEQIASLVGYNDIQSFRKVFGQFCGVSASRYRVLNKGRTLSDGQGAPATE